MYSTISSRDSRIVLPTSRVIISAISSARSMQMENGDPAELDALEQRDLAPGPERLDGGLHRASTCAGDEAATVPSSSPVAGLVTSISSPSPGIHLPSM